MAEVKETRQWQRTFCPHCQESVSKSTYCRHRERYHNKQSGKWICTGNRGVDTAEKSELHASTSSCSDESMHDMDTEETPVAAQTGQNATNTV